MRMDGIFILEGRVGGMKKTSRKRKLWKQGEELCKYVMCWGISRQAGVSGTQGTKAVLVVRRESKWGPVRYKSLISRKGLLYTGKLWSYWQE